MSYPIASHLRYQIERDWPDSNRRPSASDLCEFPHSPDYTFTLGLLPLGGGRLVSRPSQSKCLRLMVRTLERAWLGIAIEDWVARSLFRVHRIWPHSLMEFLPWCPIVQEALALSIWATAPIYAPHYSQSCRATEPKRKNRGWRLFVYSPWRVTVYECSIQYRGMRSSQTQDTTQFCPIPP